MQTMNHQSHSRDRVILLLDLDCFYAQCETVRLGLDPSIPLCLLQWNSALAVNYPAREKFGLKRGASFEEIQEVSRRGIANGDGECVALHLPVVSVAELTHQTQNQERTDIGDDDHRRHEEGLHDRELLQSSPSSMKALSVKEAYEKEFHQPPSVKKELYAKEKNRMRHGGEGKASLDRYRLASTMIFDVILDTLEQHLVPKRVDGNASGIGNSIDARADVGATFILEKASIDELYIDVTQLCYDFDSPVWNFNCGNKDKDRDMDIGSEDRIDQDQQPMKDTKEELDSTKISVSIQTNESAQKVSIAPAAPSLQDSPPSLSVAMKQMAEKETIVCAKQKIEQSDLELDDNGIGEEMMSPHQDPHVRALKRGCIIARAIRKEVFDSLGFTLSAGISTNKLMAKLCASYGKPNGQAVGFPDAIPYILEETKIRKTRNLGGKIGKAVLEMLPENEDTMGSIRRLLTLEELTTHLGSSEMGRMVYDYSNGIDYEPVKQTKGALTKSITAFKSFSVRSREDVTKWITLLATDMLLRVDVDSSRNNRFPTTCTIQFYVRGQNGKRNRNGKSVRIPFPSSTGSGNLKCERNAAFITKVAELLNSNCDDVTNIVRLGLCAVNFQQRAKRSIGSFFSVGAKSHRSSPEGLATGSASTNIITNNDSALDCSTAVRQKCIINSILTNSNRVDELKDRKCNRKNYFSNIASTQQSQLSISTISSSKRSPDSAQKSPNVKRIQADDKIRAQVVVASHSVPDLDPDLAYAKKLQAKYDRENKILTSTERKGDSASISTGEKRANVCHNGRNGFHFRSKKSRIENFFKPKKEK